MNTALKVTHLTVNYDRTPVLWDINLEVPEGKLVGIMGPNGAGKSSFIKTCLGLIQPISGAVEFFGKPLKKARHRIAYVPQRESVDWDFPITVLELVLMGRYGRLGLFRSPRKADRDAAMHYLGLVGMSGFHDRQISQLSGGQQQRVFLARSLMQEADIYFLDEPFTGIDHATEKALIKLLQDMRSERKSIFVVHHDLGTADSYFDWTILLNMRLVASGPTLTSFNSVNLSAAYGRNPALLDEAIRLSQDKKSGMA